jgi:hypothetical protein
MGHDECYTICLVREALLVDDGMSVLFLAR